MERTFASDLAECEGFDEQLAFARHVVEQGDEAGFSQAYVDEAQAWFNRTWVGFREGQVVALFGGQLAADDALARYDVDMVGPAKQ
jgi:hypothetical protein